MPDHVVVSGDCIRSLADASGLYWRTVWDHPGNAALKQNRKDPNILHPGDRVFIPEKELKDYARGVDTSNKFLRKGTPAKFRLRVMKNGKPRASKAYKLVIDGRLLSGQTDANGWLEHPIAPGAIGGMLTLTATGEEIPVRLGHLDPITEIAGIQERLRNLGYLNGDISGEMDSATSGAIAAFQKKAGLSENGRVDGATRDELKRAHGS